jgi:alpha-L-glutamate ligase-like protein
MFGLVKKLAAKGIMGINRRNCQFTQIYNPRRYHPLVDDKLKTKKLALNSGIAVPELYGVIEIEHQIIELPLLLGKYSNFVLKPAHGSGGDGVLVIVGKVRNLYRKANGKFIDQEELNHHISNILNGLFSIGGHDDKAIIEYLVKHDPVFEAITYQGVPDIRIIVFQGIPVIAMARLPTSMSDGKANLHQGAIGAGIDIATGQTLSAVWKNDIVYEHPDTQHPVQGIQIPRWDELLHIAAYSYEMTGMGYIGVDIVLDRDLGPLVLELNARPGLNIQIANKTGLIHRLEFIEANGSMLGTIEDRISFAKKVISQIH